MSDAPDRDVLAAEYVLGTLEGEEAREAARLLRDDPVFSAAVRAWEARLAPLADTVTPVPPPPDLWDRIATATGTTTVVPLSFRRRMRVWQASTGVAFAIAASLAAFIVLRPAPAPRVAVLAPLSGGVPVLLATAEPNGTLLVTPSGTIAVPTDHDLELWALAEGDKRPRSLGVLPAGGRQLVASLSPGTQLLVSLEPRGGSPTGQPTGPVLYGGRLAAVDAGGHAS
jgi:anti-sigma-K factor RskA